MDQNHAHHVRLQVRIELHRVTQEIVDGADRFHSGKSAPGDHHRQRRLPRRLVHLVVGQFQRVDHSVAQEDGVAQGFHRQSMLCQTWDVIKVRHRAERQDELVVGHVVRRRQIAVPDAHLPLRESIASSRYSGAWAECSFA